MSGDSRGYSTFGGTSGTFHLRLGRPWKSLRILAVVISSCRKLAENVRARNLGVEAVQARGPRGSQLGPRGGKHGGVLGGDQGIEAALFDRSSQGSRRAPLGGRDRRYAEHHTSL